MKTNFVIPATNGIYISQEFDPSPLSTFMNQIDFEFYNDLELTIPSTGMTGTITINAKPSINSKWQNVPNTSIPSTVDVSNSLLLQFAGIVQQFQIITSGIANTNYINIIYNISFPK